MTDFNMWGYLGYRPPEPCKHQVVDNGTRRSECKLCKVAMEFNTDMQWVAVTHDEPQAYDDQVVLKGLAAWIPRQGTAAYHYGLNRLVRLGDNDND